MLAWLISIAVAIIFAVVIGYALWYATGFLKGADKDSREVCSGFSGMAVGALGIIFILFSMFNSCTSDTPYEYCMESSWIYYVLLSLIITAGCVFWLVHGTKKGEQKRQMEDEAYLRKYGLTKAEYEKKKFQERLDVARRKRQNVKQLLIELEQKYGKVSFSTTLNNSNGRLINVYEEGKVILALNEDKVKDAIPFWSIIDFTVDDEITSSDPDRATTTSKVSTGSMLGRGLAGGLVFGQTGAIIGATTAKRTAETIIEKGEVAHRYSISINIDSISHPIYTMDFGSDLDKCRKLSGVLSVIVKRNKTSHDSSRTEELTITPEDPISAEHFDSLLKDVAREVVASGVASTSAIQRRYAIAYSRAASIMDQLEELEVVGPSNGGKPRDVLADVMKLESILENL